jgi:hypothetical protein
LSNEPSNFPIILEFDADRQPRAALPRELELLSGDGDPHHLHAVVGRRMMGESAPAATDVQQAFAGSQLQLAADQFELVPLGFGQVGGVRPIAAGVAHRGIEHGLEHVVADVVVPLADFERAWRRLRIEE